MKSLKTRGICGISESDIQTTHYYIKFKPKDENELEVLKRDTTIVLYGYPLDCEMSIPFNGLYRDPEVPEGVPTYQYASIPYVKWQTEKEYLAQIVEYEVLEELFIPDEFKNGKQNIETRTGILSVSYDFISELVTESLMLTGNEDPTISTTRAEKWTPAGRIYYFDESSCEDRGMTGIKVRARRWFTTHIGFCNEDGYYSCDGMFERDANYSFNLERHEFKINGVNGVTTEYDGPKQTGNWDYYFTRSYSQPNYAATVAFRAAYHYYYQDIGGLRRPPQNSFWNTQLKLKIMNEEDSSNGTFNSARRFLGLDSAIKLYNPHNNMVDLYATAIHEMAHAAHWRMVVDEPNTNRVEDYHNAEDKMLESWARGVQWFLTSMMYTDYPGGNISSVYTNVVIDMVDTEEDNSKNKGKSSDYGDNVDGYTMPQIETALIGCNTFNEWRDNIKNLYDNETEENLDELFAAW